MKSLFKSVVLITVFSVLTRILGFLFRIILSRVVGAEGVGIYQVASSVFMVLLTIVSSGLPLIISRMGASYIANKDKKREASLVSVALVYSLILSIFLCVIVIVFRNLFSKLLSDERCIQILIILLPSLVFSAVYSVFRGALWGRGNYFALCVSELYEQVVRIILGILAISTTFTALENALNVGWTMTLACLLSMIFVTLLFFYYGGKLGKLSKKEFSPLIKQSTPITLMRIAGSFISPLVAIIIPARLIAIGYTSNQAMSLFGVAMGMTFPLLFIPTTIIGSLSTALVPEISTALAQNNKKYIEERVVSSITFALFISAMFVPVFMGLGEQIGEFLYDNTLSGTLLQTASWVMIPLGLTNISSSVLNSLGLEKKSFINFIIGSIVMFLALWFLPPLFGINSLIWGMGLNYLIVSSLNILLIKRKLNLELKLSSKIIRLAISLLPSAALTTFIVSLSNYIMPLFVTLMIGGVVSVSSYILLGSVMNLFDVKAFLISAKNKFNFPKIKLKKKQV